MATNKTDIFVFAHWAGMAEPELLGILSAHQAKGRKAFSLEYGKNWLKTKEQSVQQWKNVAKTIGISRAEQELMSSAFSVKI